MRETSFTRRRFLRNAALTFPVTTIFIEQTASAQDLPHLELDDPTAKALLYVHDADNVDTSNPLAARYEEGQHCGNCVQLQGEEGEDWRPCTLFPGKLVATAGWCSAWVAKPDTA
jgi:hypothetical protein